MFGFENNSPSQSTFGFKNRSSHRLTRWIFQPSCYERKSSRTNKPQSSVSSNPDNSDTYPRSLIFLTAVSFFPQYYRIWDLENCTGISLLYVFLNLIASTEHFSFGLHYILEDGLAGGNGNNVESWINLYLVTIVWGCFLLL